MRPNDAGRRSDATGGGGRHRRRFVRPLRVLVLTIGAAFALVLLLMALVLMPPVRRALLVLAVPRLAVHLPGRLTIGQVAWPAPGALSFHDLVWVDRGDTLVVAQDLAVSIDLAALFKRDLALGDVKAVGLCTDLPALMARFPKNPAASPTKSSFPRPGSVPGLPSVALERLSVDAPWVRLPDSTRAVEVRATGGLELRAGRAPEIRLDQVTAQDPERGWGVDSSSFDISFRTGTIRALARGRLLPDWPFFLAITPTGPSAFHLLLVPQEGDQPPQSIGVSGDARVVFRGARLETLDFDGLFRTPGTDELARLSGLEKKLATAPTLEGVSLSAQGTFRLDPRPRGTISLAIQQNSWIDGGKVDATLFDQRVTLDTLRLACPDLALDASGTMAGDSVVARASLRLVGSRLLEQILPGVKLPDSLRALVDASINGPRTKPGGNILVRARAHVEQSGVDTVRIEAQVRNGWKEPAQIQVAMQAFNLLLLANAAADLSQPSQIHLAPIRILEKSADGTFIDGKAAGTFIDGNATGEKAVSAGAREELTGTIRLPSETEDLALQDVRVTGALGDLLVAGELSRSRAAPFHLRWTWTEPPAPLIEQLRRQGGQIDSLRSAWAREGPFKIEGAGTIGPVTEGVPPIDSDGTFVLPGPSALAALMPAAAGLRDLGAIRGRFQARTVSSAEGNGVRALLDLDSTAWIDTGRVAIAIRDRQVTLDTLILSLPGLRALAHAERGDSSMDIRGRIQIPDTRFVGRFVPLLSHDFRLNVDATGMIQGDRKQPVGGIALAASAAGPNLNIPELAANVELTGGGFHAHLLAPRGADFGLVHVDTLNADYVASSFSGFPGTLQAHFLGPDVELSGRAHIAQGRGLVLTADTLSLRLDKSGVSTTHPFSVELAGPDSSLVVREMDLEGSLGTIRANGALSPGGSDLSLALRLKPPKDSPLLSLLKIPPEVLPDELTVDLRASGRNTLNIVADATGLELEPSSRPLSLHADLVTNGPEINGKLDFRTPDSTVVQGTFRLPAMVRIYPPQGSLQDGPVFIDTRFAGFPLPLTQAGMALAEKNHPPAQLDGLLRIRGTARDPSASFEGTVRFPHWKNLSAYALQLSALARPRAGSDSSATSLAGGQSLLRTEDVSAPAPGITAAIALRREAQTVLTGALFYPVAWSLMPTLLPKAPAGTMSLKLDSERLDLGEFSELLPPSTGLAGTAKFGLSATGDPNDPRIDGQIQATTFSVILEDGSTVDAEGSVKLGGTALAPSALGTITIHHGVLILPSAPPNLLAEQGPSFLRQLAYGRLAGRDTVTVHGYPGSSGRSAAQIASSARKDSLAIQGARTGSAAPADTTLQPAAPADTTLQPAVPSDTTLRAATPTDTGPRTSERVGRGRRRPTSTQFRPSYAVRVIIPGNLMVRGQGLDVELAGELHLEQNGLAPTLVGELSAPRGTYNFLGRNFQVQSGTVVYNGGDVTNPTLDLTLVSTIGQTQVQVHLRGTALIPELTLSSIPDMSEGDIMSLVVFGVPLGTLDTAQMNLLQSRASQMAASYAATELTARLSRQLGVDILTIATTEGPEPQSALVVGKYLSPKVLLQYRQALAQGNNVLVNLDYFLSRHWKIESILGWHTQSGLNVAWTDEY